MKLLYSLLDEDAKSQRRFRGTLGQAFLKVATDRAIEEA
jgi:hypothetical protein